MGNETLRMREIVNENHSLVNVEKVTDPLCKKELCVGKGGRVSSWPTWLPVAVVIVMTSNLLKAAGHLPLHLLNGIFSCLVLVNQFVLGFFQLLQQLLHPALELVGHK